MTRFLLFLTLIPGLTAQTQRQIWNKPASPFQVLDNLYYVGTAGLSSFLIKTPQGSILLDAGLPESAPLLEKNMATLGLRLRDIKVIVNSHAHYDHCGGLAELKQASGAKLAVSRQDTPVVEAGKDLFGTFPPVHVDRQLADGDVVEVGGVRLTAHLTPGHTKGCTTWTFPLQHQGKTLQVVYYCSTTVVDKLVGNKAYPHIVGDYQATFPKVKALKADVFLAPHAGFFHLEEKRARLESGDSSAFVDSNEMTRFVMESERDFAKALRDAQAER